MTLDQDIYATSILHRISFQVYPQSNLVVLLYVDDYVYWYAYEELGNWFVDTLGKRFYAKLIGYAHWFM